jgi:hypothetical protein
VYPKDKAKSIQILNKIAAKNGKSPIQASEVENSP